MRKNLRFAIGYFLFSLYAFRCWVEIDFHLVLKGERRIPEIISFIFCRLNFFRTGGE
ncbi:hypothetical protein D922_02135 [Enterococcus faecalis 06-MB-DW-09]|nr:hypothetical protein D931_03407 [Enterococcus faecium 13.SD.W.09]EPH93593.1 hypothetical protein D922_02135 [Enterococcus faecalis 06-MB-DW-09]